MFKRIVTKSLIFNETAIYYLHNYYPNGRSSPPEVFLEKRCFENMQQIWRRIPISRNFIEITLRHGCSPANLLHIFRTPFPKNTFGGAASEIYYSEKKSPIKLYFFLCFVLHEKHDLITSGHNRIEN